MKLNKCGFLSSLEGEQVIVTISIDKLIVNCVNTVIQEGV